MPEGPETFIVARQLKRFIGRTLEKIISKKIKLDGPKKLTDVKVRGKQIVFCFAGGIYLGVHFMLTGRFCLEPDKNVRATFHFGDDILYFCDARNFAHFVWMNRDELKAMLAKIGPSIMNIDEDEFVERYSQHPKTKIATLLHDQSVVSGIGNYLRAEAIYRSKISPINKIADVDLHKLYASLKYLVDKIVESGGTEDYPDIDGKFGTYKYKVYGKKITSRGEPVKKIKIGSQNVYYV